MQKARGAYEPNLRALRPAEAFYLGTHGGARALGKAQIIGTLTAGKEADLTIVDLAALAPYGIHNSYLDQLSTEDVVALCIYRGGPHATLATYVRGCCVYQSSGSAPGR